MSEFQKNHLPLYHMSVVVLFWALADSVFSFIIPIIMNDVLNDLSLVGLIFGSSSFFGLLIDFWMGSEQKNRNYKSYFLITFSIAILAYIVALQSNIILGFILVMALWGAYFELHSFALVDFVRFFSKSYERSRSWGVIQTFNSLGYLLGPILGGAVILQNRYGLWLSLGFILLAFIFFMTWFRKGMVCVQLNLPREPFLKEMKLWLMVARKAKRAFWCRFLLYVWDSLLWSMGSIMVTTMFGKRGALLFACFLVPSVFLQGLAGYWADKKGKKKFVIAGLVIAGIFMAVFSQVETFWIKAVLALISAVGAAMVWPAIDGIFTDIIGNLQKIEEEVSAVRGSAANLAYIVTPIVGGSIGSIFGLPAVFFLVGLFVALSALVVGFLWVEKN